jgi:hypothetical protein
MDDEESEDSQKRGVAYLYIIFAVMCIITSLFIYTTVPETKGKTYEDFLPEDHPQYAAHAAKSATRRDSDSDWNNPLRVSDASSTVELSHS